MDLDALFNNLLSSGIEATDPEATKKVKVLNTFHLVFIMMAPLLGLFYFYIGAIFLFYVFIIAGVLMISSLILLRKTLNITVAGNCAIFILWATLFMMTWVTGPFTPQGVIKPPLMMNGGLILLSMFFLGYLWGAAWTILVFVETGVIVYLFLIQYPFPNLIPAEISEIYTLGTYLFALLILFVFAFLYEKGKREVSTPGQKKPPTLKESIQTIQEFSGPVLGKEPMDSGSTVLSDESFGDPVFRTDLQGMICFWNRACEEQYGYSSSQMMGQSPEPLISKEHKTNFKKTIMDVSNGANFTNKEWKYHTHDGKVIYVLAKAYPLQSSDKMRRECVIVSRDITDLKLKQKRVERYAAESKEKMKKLTEEYDLVKKNIASFIRKKNDSEPSS